MRERGPEADGVPMGAIDVHKMADAMELAEEGDKNRDRRGQRPQTVEAQVLSYLPALFGFVLAWFTLLVAHSPLIHAGSSALDTKKLKAPNAATCKVGDCWDRAEKYGYPECTPRDLVWSKAIRGVELPAAGKICYKSIYINSEFNSGVALGMVMFWGVYTARIAEGVAEAVLAGDVEPRAAGALAACLPAWYYSVKVMFVYVNEWMHRWIPSQLFFSATDGTVLYIMARHARRSGGVNLPAMCFVAVTAFTHIVEILLDENSNFINPKNLVAGRNIILSLADVALLLSSVSIIQSQRRGIKTVQKWAPYLFALFIGELVAFQIFATDLSFSLFKRSSRNLL
uniref:Uncharacterized protein n=1 Tax=Hemiselmis tepida TaxID=464990 RepID=A0A7S0VWV6_9CRYP|mmetsp:Transcript_2747/g.7020  ORF Transcript_2747/g.7020 Transcript_2747/m.7020 type:complete len:342 (+) Transcript_2747:19-1044(+)